MGRRLAALASARSAPPYAPRTLTHTSAMIASATTASRSAKPAFRGLTRIAHGDLAAPHIHENGVFTCSPHRERTRCGLAILGERAGDTSRRRTYHPRVLRHREDSCLRRIARCYPVALLGGGQTEVGRPASRARQIARRRKKPRHIAHEPALRSFVSLLKQRRDCGGTRDREQRKDHQQLDQGEARSVLRHRNARVGATLIP